MKRLLTMLAAGSLASGLLLAQSTGESRHATRSWTGTLVAAGCQSAPAMARSTDSEAAAIAMAKSTPTMNGREQNRPFEQQQNQADPVNTPASTGSADRTRALNATDEVATPRVDSLNTRGSAPLDNGRGSNSAQAADRGCRIDTQTNAFALRLGDGRLVRFDDASNAKIAQELQSGDRLKHKSKTIHAKVKGTMSGDSISADSIKL